MDINAMTYGDLKTVLKTVKSHHKEQRRARGQVLDILNEMFPNDITTVDSNYHRFSTSFEKIELILKTKATKVNGEYLASVSVDKISFRLSNLSFVINELELFNPKINGCTYSCIVDGNFAKKKYLDMTFEDMQKKSTILNEFFSVTPKEEVVDHILLGAIQPIIKMMLGFVKVEGLRVPDRFSKTDPDLFALLKSEVEKNIDIDLCLDKMWETCHG
jgi:hypothetical protein